MSSFHKTTSECWQRTPDTQNGSPFSLKRGKTKYKGAYELMGRKGKENKSY